MDLPIAATTGAAIISGINNAIGIIKQVRSSNVSEVPLSTFLQLGDQLIEAQLAILTLQKEILEKTEEAGKLRVAISEKEKYSLVEIVPGTSNFAYARNIAPVSSATSLPSTSEPFHYVCQGCFDKGIKSVLQRQYRGTIGSRYSVLVCHQCSIAVLNKNEISNEAR